MPDKYVCKFYSEAVQSYVTSLRLLQHL